jgi:hypothetical protein
MGILGIFSFHFNNGAINGGGGFTVVMSATCSVANHRANVTKCESKLQISENMKKAFLVKLPHRSSDFQR